MSAVPDRIALPHVGVVLRRYHDSDIDGLYATIEKNRDHLRPHMPWADESRHEFMAFVTEAIAQWDRGADRNYAIVDDTDGRYLGACGLHDRIGPDGREIGYWLIAAATGRGIVTAAARALTATALAMDGVTRVEIHCDEANGRSAAVARRLGCRLDRVEADRISAPGDLGRSMIWMWPPTGLAEPTLTSTGGWSRGADGRRESPVRTSRTEHRSTSGRGRSAVVGQRDRRHPPAAT